ncbi:MAG: dihydrodipicolinate synthase family protein [Clostridia bacterium]|nr:dihydrodipicolinate synthase family protein [Clostridia bacterium]
MKKFLTGPFTVLLTPFSGDKVDMATYEKQILSLNESDISGYVTNGSTGEFVSLSLEEQMQLTEAVAKLKAKDKKMVVSACTACLADTVKLCCHAGEVGADAVLVCPPYYFKYSAKEREEYFISVADNSPVPVILYNIPFFTQEIELPVIYRLFEHPNIMGIKDSSANMKRLAHMVQVTEGTEKSILTGTDDILLPALVGGCVGSFTAFAAIYPDEVCAIYKAVEAGDYKRAREVQFSLMPMLREADSETFPKGYKKLMSKVSGSNFSDKEIGN